MKRETLVAEGMFKHGVQVQIWLHDFLMLMEMKKLYIIKNSNKTFETHSRRRSRENTGSSFLSLSLLSY